MDNIKNRFLKFFALGVAFAFFLTPKLVLAATLSLNPSVGTFNRGCSFSIKVDVDTQGVQTDGTDAILSYDSSELTPLSITNGIIYPDFPGNFIDTQAKEINISGLASVSTAFIGNGTLAVVNFTVPQTAPLRATQLNFKFDPNDKTKTTDSNVVERGTVADVLNNVVNGNYTIGTGVCIGQGQVNPTAGPGGSLAPGSTSTPSATPIATPPGELPPGGLIDNTLLLTIIGSGLALLGILGLALL